MFEGNLTSDVPSGVIFYATNRPQSGIWYWNFEDYNIQNNSQTPNITFISSASEHRAAFVRNRFSNRYYCTLFDSSGNIQMYSTSDFGKTWSLLTQNK